MKVTTHSTAAFYEAFSPQQARRLTKKLEFHYTPEHSSWLNMAEVQISVLKIVPGERRTMIDHSSPNGLRYRRWGGRG